MTTTTRDTTVEAALVAPIEAPAANIVVRPAVEMIHTTMIVTEHTVGNSFRARYAGHWRYCHKGGAWFEWTGVNWQKNEVQLAFHFTRLMIASISHDSLEPKERKAVERKNFARAVEEFCKADPTFATDITAWDSDPFKLGTPGGTVDLRSGRLYRATPNDLITKMTAIAPAATATCPLWLKFLNETTGNDGDLIRFLQQWTGYNLTGDTREHALLFVFGSGGNGKSVFINILNYILGTYAKTAAMSTFISSKNEQHSTELAMLQGARMVTASETEEGKAWAEAKIKSLTGGDEITARFMRQDFFTFKPQFKLTIIGNHKPRLHNVDDAIRRRFDLIPFTRKPISPDRELEAKLREEAPGILRWMIEGCLDWQTNGLSRPQSVAEATEAYFDDQDLLGQWLEERCDTDLNDTRMWTPIAELFTDWEEYAERAREFPGVAKTLSEKLANRGYAPKRQGRRGRGYFGIKLKQPTPGLYPYPAQPR